jgi:hypothetical protein
METGAANNVQGDGDDVDLDIGYTDDHARDQSDEAAKWLSTYGDTGLLDHSQSDGSLYKYMSLEDSNYIRFLVLCPSPSPNEDFKGFLRYVKLDISPPFEALSYVWSQKSKDGVEDAKNGVENAEYDLPNTIAISSGYLDVTENLNDALKALRFEGKERILWVDALCISQNDKEKKSVQVAMMGRSTRKLIGLSSGWGKIRTKII